MFKITILQISKSKNSYRDLEAEFIKRLSVFSDLEIIDIAEAKTNSSEKNKELEGEELLKKIPQGYTSICLDENGQQYKSADFAELLSKHKNHGAKLCFIIGGPFGLSDQILEKVDHKLALSKMTFTHQMVRMIFLEQLYRAFTIMTGKTYHY